MNLHRETCLVFPAVRWGHRSSELRRPLWGLYQISSYNDPHLQQVRNFNRSSSRSYCLSLTLLSINLIFRDELQWVAEYSEAWQPFRWSIIYKFVAQAIPTLSATYLECPWSFQMFGHTILLNSLGESRPRRGVLILGSTGEQLMVTLWTHINSGIEVVFVKLSSEKRAKRHRLLWKYYCSLKL